MDHTIFVGMSKPISRTYALLNNEETATQEIDRVIIECVHSRLPVFIYVPTDVVNIPVNSRALSTPLDTAVQNSDKDAESTVVKKVLKALKNATKPAILADVLAIRHGARNLTRKLVDVTHFQTFATPMSKGIVDENSPHYNGVYSGQSMISSLIFTEKTIDTGTSIFPWHPKCG